MRKMAYIRSLTRFIYRSASLRRRRVRLYWVVIVLIVITMVIFAKLPVHFVFSNDNIYEPCVLPKLDPFDKTIMQFVTKLEPLDCGSKPPLLYVDGNGMLELNKTTLRRIGETEGSIKCSYAPLVRHAGDEDVSLSKVTSFTPPVRLDHDFVRVTCVNGKSANIYDQTLTNVAAHGKQGRADIGAESDEAPSVLLFGLDSTSRSAAIRFLPKTFAYLTDVINVYDFEGFMKVGDNTIPNMLALLTGRRVFSTELPHTDYYNNYFDSFPLLWKNFSAQKYVTLFAEDMPTRNMFNNGFKGFNLPPTDHYMRPFWLATFSGAIKDTLSKLYRFLGSKALKVGQEKVFCTEGTPTHQILLNYIKQFLQRYKGKRKLAMSFLTEIGHEYQTYIQYADEDFVEFFKWMKNDGHLANTIVVFFSDHGSRYDFVRNTYVGRVESRMPILAIHIPDHLKAKYPNIATSLDTNTNRLTTFYDVHQTLVDILNKNFANPSELHVDGKLRGVSLFRPISATRSCAEAWISQDYCACYDSEPISIENNILVQDIVKQILVHINNLVSSTRKCAVLKLFKVKSVIKMNQGLKYKKTENRGISLFQFSHPEEKHFGQYTVTLETVPGHAIFDVSVTYGGNAGIQVLGDIERTNKYGNQSACIQDKDLKQICFCISR